MLCIRGIFIIRTKKKQQLHSEGIEPYPSNLLQQQQKHVIKEKRTKRYN